MKTYLVMDIYENLLENLEQYFTTFLKELCRQRQHILVALVITGEQ